MGGSHSQVPGGVGGGGGGKHVNSAGIAMTNKHFVLSQNTVVRTRTYCTRKTVLIVPCT